MSLQKKIDIRIDVQNFQQIKEKLELLRKIKEYHDKAQYLMPQILYIITLN